MFNRARFFRLGIFPQSRPVFRVYATERRTHGNDKTAPGTVRRSEFPAENSLGRHPFTNRVSVNNTNRKSSSSVAAASFRFKVSPGVRYQPLATFSATKDRPALPVSRQDVDDNGGPNRDRVWMSFCTSAAKKKKKKKKRVKKKKMFQIFVMSIITIIFS